MIKQHMSLDMEECIKECIECHHICFELAMNHCLERSGEHTEPAHFRLMINCAEICQLSANFMISGSDLHTLTCDLCAEICRRCADDCEQLDGMDECVEACRRCAETCERVAA